MHYDCQFPIGAQYRDLCCPSVNWLIDFVSQEAMFMGNGEQYIWKPPEEDEIITLHPPPIRKENAQGHPSPPTAKEVLYICLCVCVHAHAFVCIHAAQGRQTGLWFVTAVFTYWGAHLIGRAVIILLHCDPPVIQCFCLQPEVELHRARPIPLSELWPQSPPAPNSSICT